MMEVILLAALSADGFIARATAERSTKWTSKEDARWFSQKTKEIGVCVLGRTTYETIGRPLPGRMLIVLSSEGQPIEQLAAVEPPAEGSVFLTSSDPAAIVVELTARGVTRLAVCGGSSVYAQFLKLKLVNHLYLTIEPVLFGTGITLANQPLDTRLRLLQLHPLSQNTLVLEYLLEPTPTRSET